MEAFRHEAEILRLARLLSCAPSDLACLSRLSATELRSLRLSCDRSLLQLHQPVLQRSLHASKLLPTALLAAIGEGALGPLLCARVSEQMSVPRLASICRHVSPSFMAAVSVHMDSDRLAEMAGALPLPIIYGITRELVARREFITLGEVIERLPPEVIRPVVTQLHDGEAVLRTCFFVEYPSRLHLILEQLSEDNLREIVDAAADPALDLLPHAVALAMKVFPSWQRRLFLVTLGRDDRVLAGLLQGIHRHDLWRRVLPLSQHLPPHSYQRLMGLPGWQQPEILRGLLRSATSPALRAVVERMLEAMPAPRDGRTRQLRDDFRAGREIA